MMSFRALMHAKRQDYLAGPDQTVVQSKGEVGAFLSTFDDLDGLDIGGGKSLSAAYDDKEDKYTVVCGDVEATVTYNAVLQKFIVAVDAPSAGEKGEVVAKEDEVRDYLANFLGMYLDVQGE